MEKKKDAIFIILISLIIVNVIFIIFTQFYIWTHELTEITEKYFESVNLLLIGSLISQIIGGFGYNSVKKHVEAKYTTSTSEEGEEENGDTSTP